MNKQITILVTGGAGYVGSHVVKLLNASGHRVVIFDNLSTGHIDSVPKNQITVADLSEKKSIDKCFRESDIDVVMHFASSISVGESVVEPAKYYQNNVVNTINLLDSMREHGVNKIVFSSTAAVYGVPKVTPIPIDHPRAPVNPYGKSKVMVEQIIEDYSKAYNLQYAFLRYFNAAGADPEGGNGERHDPETHLIPLALQVASGRKKELIIYGDDYNTPDGTCIRDYVHVCDIAQAHLLAMNYLDINEENFGAFNLGAGVGHSVKEVISTVELVTGKKLNVRIEKRRDGDSPVLVADYLQASSILNWIPIYCELKDIVKHAWHWEQRVVSSEKISV